jgi:hypothetical protein
MAIDQEAHRISSFFRGPLTLMALSSQDGHTAVKIETCDAPTMCPPFG